MYHTNEAYKTTVANYPQKFNLSIEVTFDESTGLDTVTVPPEDIFEAGFSEELFLSTFCIGSTVEPRFWVRMHNPNGKYSENALATAEIRPCMTLYNEADEAVDTVPIGVFHVTKIAAQNSDLRLECMDRMDDLHTLFEPQGVETSLYALGRRIAQTVRAEFKSTPQNLITSVGKRSILQQTVNDSIFKGYSYAQVLSCIAEVCGSFAIFDNEGNLWLRWFKESDVTLTGDFARSPLELNGNTFSMDGNIVQVTGVNVVSEDTELARVGTDEYLLTLNENPIANAMPETAANAVLYRLKNTKYIPCRYERIGGDPSVQLGDILTIIDNKEPYNEANADTYDRYSLFLTSRNWRFNGAFTENYNASGNPDKDLNTDRGMTRSKRLAQLAKRVTEVEKNITEGMTDYEAALLMFNDKLFNAKGLYKTVREKENGGVIVYFHDETELENSHVIQMFSAAGFAWTTDGWNNGEPLWRYGFTDAGDAILNTINAYILSADIIKTGILQSQNGASWINMDDGTFCFRAATPLGMDLDTGEAIYSYEKVLELANKQLNVYGTLRNLQYPSYSVSVGPSERNDGGAFTVTDSTNGWGNLFQVYSVVGGDKKGAIWTAPFLLNSEKTNRKGISVFPQDISIFNDNYGKQTHVSCREGTVDITNSTVNLQLYRDNIMLTSYEHPWVYFNYFPPEKGIAPQVYGFGNGTPGERAGIECGAIDSTGEVKCTSVNSSGYGIFNGFLNVGGNTSIGGKISVGGSGVYKNQCASFHGNISIGNGYYEGYALSVLGTACVNGVNVTSDPELKENIAEVTNLNALSKISNMKFYSYDYKSDSALHVDIGTMAPDSPAEIQSNDGKAIDLYAYINLTTKAVQELSQKVEALEQKISELEAVNQALKQ